MLNIHFFSVFSFYLSSEFKDQLGGSGLIPLKPEKKSSDIEDREAYRIESFKEHKTG